MLCIILLNLLSGNRPYSAGAWQTRSDGDLRCWLLDWVRCPRIPWHHAGLCFAFSTFVRAALPGSIGAGVPSVCFAKTSFFRRSCLRGLPAKRTWGYSGWRVRVANIRTTIIALRERRDQIDRPTHRGRCGAACGVSIIAGYAPVAQWIERRPPEPGAGVRVSPGVPHIEVFIQPVARFA